MKKILDSIVVLDLTRFFSGPQATLLLAGMGAEVIKIDDPKTGDPTVFAPPYDGPGGISFERRSDQDMGLAYLKRARGKKSITIDLKSGRGREIFLNLAAKADVVIENFSPGVSTRLGIDYDALCKVNPAIIYCAITGYGSSGPEKDAKAYDLMVQAAVGIMSMTGHPGTPPVKIASPMSDALAGSFAANGVVAALLHRERTGEGQAIDVSMADCLFALIFDEPVDCYGRLNVAARQGNRIMRFSRSIRLKRRTAGLPSVLRRMRNGAHCWMRWGAAISRTILR
jgi:crotonobetainyl-CoA:carnitine CoA-transferase CaiB-like acyl-CoA transferase